MGLHNDFNSEDVTNQLCLAWRCVYWLIQATAYSRVYPSLVLEMLAKYIDILSARRI